MIELIALTSFSVYGLHTAVDNLLYTYTGKDLDTWFIVLREPKWAKPIIFCPVCMASIWGSIFYFIWGNLLPIDPMLHFGAWVPSIFAVAAINYVISRI